MHKNSLSRKARVNARLAGRRAAAVAHTTLTGVAWLLLLTAVIVIIGATLMVSEGARTLVGYESVGQKIDRGIARFNGMFADTGESVRDRALAAQEKVENTGKQINDRSVAVFDAGAARVDATAAAVRQGVDDVNTGMSDAAITASIKADLLKDPFLSALQVEVKTVKGEVTLTGDAASEVSRERATRMASAVAGVKRVNNHITVGAG